MMKKFKYINKITLVCLLSTALFSCVNDLNTVPIDPTVDVSENVWKNPDTYLQFLAKNYASLTLSGIKGPGDNDQFADLYNGDQGNTTLTRQLWNLEDLSTDIAKNAWKDEGINAVQFATTTPENQYVYFCFQRLMVNVAFANEYLRQTTDDQLSKRGTTALHDKVAVYRDEVRALRALNYYYLLDLYGNPPFVDENSPMGTTAYPPQISRSDLFKWIEAELKSIETDNLLPATDYSRMSLATVRTMLAKLYLNAEVYTGTSRWADAATYAKKVIDAYPAGINMSSAMSYDARWITVEDPTTKIKTIVRRTDAPLVSVAYRNLFRADNHNCSNEIIFGLPFDHLNATTYGGTTFLICSSLLGDDMVPTANFGISGGWGGNRATQQLTSSFEANDRRYMFWKDGRDETVDDVATFKQGYSVTKFSDLPSDADTTSLLPTANSNADTDFPLFRLADVYLMYAEALVRQNSSSSDIATYFNKVHTRAGLAALSVSQITLDVLLNERLHELYYEAQRRIDLIRFGKFISGYNWAFKGGVKDGQDLNPRALLYPIPSIELGVNPNLKQNPGY